MILALLVSPPVASLASSTRFSLREEISKIPLL
jgi:hypothetical protein